MSSKLQAGLSMLRDARQGEFDTAGALVHKVLNNVVASPDEAKFRKLRTTNAKIGAMLATRGMRAILIGAGFVEEGEFLTLPDDASLEGVQAALAGLAAQAEERAAEQQAEKTKALTARKEESEKENEERKRMRDGIADDAAARKEPGWKAKVRRVPLTNAPRAPCMRAFLFSDVFPSLVTARQAAGVKDGKAITGCSDVGIGNSSGG
jgi:hypothetical protein